jgi:putative transposase
MPRVARVAPGGEIFHCLNRGNDRRDLFDGDGDFAAFERVLEATLQATPTRLLAYCLMHNHWHLLLWPRQDGELAAFMHRLTTMHVRRRHRHRQSEGRGHLYQGVCKSFPVQDDRHFLTVARYIERNPLRAKMVRRCEDWRWCSFWQREHGSPHQRGMLAEWPVARPEDWRIMVNRPQTDKEEAELAECIRRGRPFGEDAWRIAAARRMNLEATFRPRGRPKKNSPTPI